MIGTRARWAPRRWATSKPSMSGSITSSTIRCGRNEATFESASAPAPAVSIVNPWKRSAIETTSTMFGSSSTTRMRCCSGEESLIAPKYRRGSRERAGRLPGRPGGRYTRPDGLEPSRLRSPRWQWRRPVKPSLAMRCCCCAAIAAAWPSGRTAPRVVAMPDSASANAAVSASAVATKPTRRSSDPRGAWSGVGSSTVISVVPFNKIGVRYGALPPGERDPDDEPAGRPGAQLDRAAVRLGDRAHDREPEPDAVAPRAAVQALEGLEQRRQRVGRDHVPVVADLDGAEARRAGGVDLDRAALPVVPHGILDEVRDEALEQPPVAADGGRVEGRAHVDVARGRVGAGLAEGEARRVGEVDVVAAPDAALRARKRQQRLDEPLGRERRVAHRLGHRAQLRGRRVGVGQRDLELGADHR